MSSEPLSQAPDTPEQSSPEQAVPPSVTPVATPPPSKPGMDKKTVTLIVLIALAVLTVGGWALFIVKNIGLNKANAEIANKAATIEQLNGTVADRDISIEELTTENTSLTDDLAASTLQAKKLASELDGYKCQDIPAEDFDMSGGGSMRKSLDAYLESEYGDISASAYLPVNETSTEIYLVLFEDDSIRVFVLYYSDDSVSGKNRVFDYDNECFIEK